MKFWDSSAIVPLCIRQPASERAAALYASDPGMVVWWATPVECASAFARLVRDDILDSDANQRALRVLSDIQDRSFEVQPILPVRALAGRLLRVHPLRAGAALQLAAALEWSDNPLEDSFVTFDDRLAEAARVEGFEVLA